MEESAAEDYEFLTGLGPMVSMGEEGRAIALQGRRIGEPDSSLR